MTINQAAGIARKQAVASVIMTGLVESVQEALSSVALFPDGKVKLDEEIIGEWSLSDGSVTIFPA